MALRMSGSEEVAEEVTQEVFISIYKNIRKFQFQSAFTTWVYRIALRRAADYYRKNQKHTRQAVSLSAGGETEPALDVSDPTQDPLKQAAEDERAQKIEEAILSLREKQRSILLLRYVKHLSYEEIAEILRCRVGTVKSRLNRAHKALEQLLREKRIDSL
jgi:RNA polymerase sigma factor (sigma-70 family)